MPEHIAAPPWMWVAFGALVVAVLAIDLGVFHRKAHEVHAKEALAWVCVWVALALVFNLGIFLWFGKKKALEFLSGYLVEEALSVDNLFVFIVIFSYFGVPSVFQHRVLFWGIVGAVLMRGIFIFAGIELIERFHGILLVFGAFLIFTGAKILLQKESEVHPERNPAVRLFRRLFPMVAEFEGPRFLVVKEGRRYATLLLLVLVVVEATDVLFAVDSIPAVLGLTRDPFIVLTSNIFAVLGLRSLYFVISGIMDKFRYLKVGLGLVLGFVGVKMILGYWEVKLQIEYSLGVIVLLLGGSVLLSALHKPGKPPVPVPENRDTNLFLPQK